MIKVSIKGIKLPYFIPVENGEGKVTATIYDYKVKLVIDSDTITIKIKNGEIIMVED
jgi:hypothetical protein